MILSSDLFKRVYLLFLLIHFSLLPQIVTKQCELQQKKFKQITLNIA
jgi:hypothetical protein